MGKLRITNFGNLSFFILVASCFFRIAHAQAGDIGTYTPPAGLPSADTNISGILDMAVSAFLPVAISIAVVMFLFAGIQYALSAGEEEQQAKAKRTIKFTIFGLVIALLAYTIVYAVTKLLG